ncbi:hypothetical protein [Rhodoblastus sp.]|uniref:hypothetical protein n=1 Tax=Rhodoblastus sp. TaxID=1962975 RepID=UPI003F9905E7
MTGKDDLRLNSGASLRIFRDAPSWDGRRTAALGELKFADAAAGAALVDSVALELAADGFGAMIGPMDGDTWHRYRVVVESDGSRPFLMEPTSGPYDLKILEAVGFSRLVEYVSARAPVAPPEAVEHVHDDIEVAAWDGKNAELLIGHVYDASLAAFAGAAFYKPLPKEDFLALYAPIIPAVDPRFVFFARDKDGRPVGFLFGMPDRLAPDGERCAILKTYAGSVRGVGRLLAQKFHIVARDLGLTGVIHALMRCDNVSRGASLMHGGQVFRRYALMGRAL